MKNQKVGGFVYGVIASVSYGLNPLFALPLYASGIGVDSVLMYRYAFALVMLGLTMKLSGKSFALKKSEILPAFVMGILFSLSSLLLFQSFNYMDAGVASTILFMYPVFVAIIMALVFHEPIGWIQIISIAFAFFGISMLYHGEGGRTLNLTGIGLVVASSLSYAIYIVGVNKSRLSSMPGIRLTFYALLFGSLVYIVRLNGLTELQKLHTTMDWTCAIGLALFPSLISMVTIAKSIRLIGPTAAAILGALEPMTALFVGVFVFDERLTGGNLVGIFFVLAAVTLLATGNKGWYLLRAALHKGSAHIYINRKSK